MAQWIWYDDLIATQAPGRDPVRSGNRITIYFDDEESAKICIEKAKRRNINYVVNDDKNGNIHPEWNGYYIVQILMRWSESRPSRDPHHLREPQILD